MKRSHIDTGPKQHGLLVIAAILTGADVLGSGGNDAGEKMLVFPVVVGKKAANGIHPFMLVFQQGTEIGIRTVLLCRIIHAGMDYLTVTQKDPRWYAKALGKQISKCFYRLTYRKKTTCNSSIDYTAGKC
jgi:hypothetical protein